MHYEEGSKGVSEAENLRFPLLQRKNTIILCFAIFFVEIFVEPAPSHLRFNKVKMQSGGRRGDVHPPTRKLKCFLSFLSMTY